MSDAEQDMDKDLMKMLADMRNQGEPKKESLSYAEELVEKMVKLSTIASMMISGEIDTTILDELTNLREANKIVSCLDDSKVSLKRQATIMTMLGVIVENLMVKNKLRGAALGGESFLEGFSLGVAYGETYGSISDVR